VSVGKALRVVTALLYHRVRMARPYLAAVGLVVVAQTYAWADNPAQDIVRSPTTPESGRLKNWQGSTVEASTYIGSGTFYASGYHDPYVSLALFAKPSYSLGTRYKLALRARIYVEEELTLPDNPEGRHFYPYDPWIWLAADNLHTFERAKIRIGGVVRTVFPLSYESRYEHMLFGIGAGPSVSRDFNFGQVNDEARKWTLKLSYGLIGVKYVQTSHFRGSGPGDETGCMAPAGGGAPGAGSGGFSGSEGDHCGGPANTNFSIANTIIAVLAHGKWSGMVSFYVANTFKYSFPADSLTADNAALTGRSDSTWGIVALSYELRPHVSLNAGVSSLQPALDSRYRYPRFPFWDLSGANGNNYSQVFFSVSGSL
jgi:hypothetical protein